jgi:hypothetical protein
MQDWPLEVADSSRVDEFCVAYESQEWEEVEKFALMELILYSIGDLEWEQQAGWFERIRPLLTRDFRVHLHTINYWRCSDELTDDVDLDQLFPITPLMRQIWDEYFKPEYAQWLEIEEE